MCTWRRVIGLGRICVLFWKKKIIQPKPRKKKQSSRRKGDIVVVPRSCSSTKIQGKSLSSVVDLMIKLGFMMLSSQFRVRFPFQSIWGYFRFRVSKKIGFSIDFRFFWLQLIQNVLGFNLRDLRICS